MLCGLPFIWTTKTLALIKDNSQKILGPRSSLLLWEICPQVLAGFFLLGLVSDRWESCVVEAWSTDNTNHLPPVPRRQAVFPLHQYRLQLLIYSTWGASTSTGSSSLTYSPCLGRPLPALSVQWQRTGGYLGMVTIGANLRETWACLLLITDPRVNSPDQALGSHGRQALTFSPLDPG